MADIERLPCGVEHELRADAAIIRSWIDVANGPINREALADRLDRYANAAAELTAEIEALRAEVERLKSMTAVTMGVGPGDGNLFVHGDYESIKAAQAIVLERDALRAEVAEAREFRDKMANAIGNDQLRRFIEKHGEPVPLTIRMQEAEARAERLAEALEDIRSRSSIDLAMRSDQFELTALLGDIHQIAGAALANGGKA